MEGKMLKIFAIGCLSEHKSKDCPDKVLRTINPTLPLAEKMLEIKEKIDHANKSN